MRSSVSLLVAAAVFCISACSDSPTGPGNPLAGLAQAERADNAPEPPSSTPSAPGHFAGLVFGYEDGPDTLGTAVRLAGVRVRAFVRGESNGQVIAGAEVASVLTNGEGRFELPTLPAGEYVVTFVPPAGSAYRGGWTVSRVWAESGESDWVIMLPKV